MEHTITPGPNPVDTQGLCLLSLDGGGVRGLSTLYILKGIMERLNHEHKKAGLPSVKPCDVFDLIGGTSTGGLIAIMLGRLEMDVDKCISAYVDLMKGVFEKKSSWLPVSLGGNVKAQFDSTKLRAAVEQAISDSGVSPTDHFNDEARGCRVFVCAAAKETGDITRLRSYDLPGKTSIEATILDAALATSAATRFFDPVRIGARQFVDGALGANNPVEQVEREASDIWCADTAELMPQVKCFISIGTGHPGRMAIEDNMFKLLSKTLVGIVAETEKTEERFIARWRQYYDLKRYFRFNVEHGLERIGLAEYDQQGTMEAATASYLDHMAQVARVRDCVLNLKQKQKKTLLSFASIIHKYNRKILLGNVDRRKPSHNIYFEQNPRFTGRTVIIDQLKDRFFGHSNSQRLALVGLGGVGKTQIALRFAYHIQETRPDYSIFWVPLLSVESAEKAFMEIARALNLQKKREDEDVKELVCQHLGAGKAGKWLFIIDNADDQHIVSGSVGKPGLEEFFPAGEMGILLMTTRSGQVAEEFAGPDVIEVEQMDPGEATELFRKHLSRTHRVQDAKLTAMLLEYLTFLPLAITQAASYLNQTKAPLENYFRLLQEAGRELPSVLGRDFKDVTRYKGTLNAVGKTWLVSFQQIKQSDQVAVRLLSFLSCIEPRAIPQTMLPDAGCEEIEWAVGTLCAYSFLAHREDTDMLDMHSLVHMATRFWVKEQGWRDQVANDAVSHFVKVFAWNTNNLRKQIIPHAMRLLEQNTEKKSSDVYRLYQQVGFCHHNDRRFKEAAKCYLAICSWKRVRLAENDPDRLQSEHSLANAYLGFRQIKDAIEVLERVVTVRKEALEEKDHIRLASEHDLARAYLEHRRIKDAIKILEHVVAVWKETVDEKDQSRLASEHELGRAYFEDGRIKDAIDVFEGVLITYTKTPNGKVQGRLSLLHALATAYSADGRKRDAAKILEEVVTIQKKRLDPKDFARLASEQVLAGTYLDDGHVKDAIRLYENVVTVMKEIIDEKDHYRIVTEHSLASAYLEDGRVKDAIGIFERVAAVQKEILDETNHVRLTSEHQLARAYHEDGRTRDAIKLFEKVVSIREDTLEKNDHNRVASEHELARAYLDDGRVKDAIKILERVTTVRKDTLDEKDLYRLASEHELAWAYLDDGRVKDAIDIFEKVVAVRREILNERDCDRLASEHELAAAYYRDGRVKDAIEIFEKVVAVQREILNESDCDRLASEHKLAAAYRRDGRVKDAIEIFEQVVTVQREILNDRDHNRIASEHELAWAYLVDRRIKDAIKIIEQVVAVQEETLDEKDHNRLTWQHRLGWAYLEDERIKDAIEIFEHVVEVRKETLGEKDHNRLASERQLARAYSRRDVKTT